MQTCSSSTCLGALHDESVFDIKKIIMLEVGREKKLCRYSFSSSDIWEYHEEGIYCWVTSNCLPCRI